MRKLVLVVLAACGGGDGGPATGAAGPFFPGDTIYTRDLTGVPPVANSAVITANMEAMHGPNGWGTGAMQIDFSLIVNEAPSGTQYQAGATDCARTQITN